MFIHKYLKSFLVDLLTTQADDRATYNSDTPLVAQSQAPDVESGRGNGTSSRPTTTTSPGLSNHVTLGQTVTPTNVVSGAGSSRVLGAIEGEVAHSKLLSEPERDINKYLPVSFLIAYCV
jgi:hypothetical protein